ncbi:gamma-glutamylcyclotransferase [Alteribacter lacisalsi]|uniref:Gamma-glutamylcyclotransferase n=1 Tax=Alteribacter lacisalsi TaxID=2045244 RepID=A0A2W0H8Y5_9BACI|nr:gamma-glutamylcyclotransferase [Alteribacter lacisalsi]PYZ98323.1 gamma-glutamylcyclotransferase [Alteribacter lacisalsi]
MMEELLFVYGTLRKGDVNHFYLNGFDCVREQAWMQGTLYDTGLGYPAADTQGKAKVYGELYRIPKEQWEALHQLEGYDGSGTSLYVPETVMVSTDTGKMKASVYIAGSERLKKEAIECGDWLRKQFEAENEDTFLYFAYGSCMDKERIREAGMENHFQEITGCSLDGYLLRFTIASKRDGKGRADLVEEGKSCEGLLYRVNRDALEYLYRREGVHAGSYRPAFVNVQSHNGPDLTKVLTFLVRDKSPAEIPPPDHYALEILRGGKGWLSETYLSSLETHIHSLQFQNKSHGEV